MAATSARHTLSSQGATFSGTLSTGLIYGGITLFLALVGMIGTFAERDVIFEVLSMGQTVLFAVIAIGGYFIGRKQENYRKAAIHGALVGATSGVVMAVFLIFASLVNIRTVFVNAAPALLGVLNFGLPIGFGAVVIVASFVIVGAAFGVVGHIGERPRDAIVTALMVMVVLGIMEDLIRTMVLDTVLESVYTVLFASSGLGLTGAIIVLLVTALLTYFKKQIGIASAPIGRFVNNPQQRVRGLIIKGIFTTVILLALPWILRLYLSDVIGTVGLYILMGLGLNIVVGFAGLLDLGYVAFFAIGAYMMAMLTSPASPLLLAGWLPFQLSFWMALPICMLVSGLAGVLLGIPVLRMRGDYLAIVTLGFGEIIRILATSEAIKPIAGGAQGILQIPDPVFFGIELNHAQTLYYVILLGCLIALYVAWRLSDSRIGRAWIAIREDEDVAEAMGVNLVQYKLLAFATGATLSGLAGAIFAVKLGSIFPHSFNLLISINVLSLIIVGGMASLPGVAVGALILVGLPELLREFAEFRLLMYGGLLVAMMLMKPEGFWPAERRRRELHEEQTLDESPATEGA